MDFHFKQSYNFTHSYSPYMTCYFRVYAKTFDRKSFATNSDPSMNNTQSDKINLQNSELKLGKYRYCSIHFNATVFKLII